MECLVVLWLGLVVLGPLIWLLHRGHKELVADLDSCGKRDFAIGFFGIAALNVCLFILSKWMGSVSHLPAVQGAAFFLPWIVNIGLLILLGHYYPQIADGAMAAIGLTLGWAILAGVLFFASCFVMAGIASLLGG